MYVALREKIISIFLKRRKLESYLDCPGEYCPKQPSKGLISCCIVRERSPLPWIETHFDPTAVHNLGRHSSNRMPHDMFADYNLSPHNVKYHVMI